MAKKGRSKTTCFFHGRPLGKKSESETSVMGKVNAISLHINVTPMAMNAPMYGIKRSFSLVALRYNSIVER